MQSIIERLKAVGAYLRNLLTPSEAAWRGAANALFVAWALLIAWSAFIELVPRFSLEQLVGFIVLYGILALAGLLLLLILWLVRLLKPRFRISLFLAMLPTVLFSLILWSQGAAIAAPLLLAGLSLLAGSIAAVRGAAGTRRVPTIVAGIVGAAALAVSTFALLAPQSEPNPALVNYHLKGRTLPLPDPAKSGPFKVTTFTYGSGKDRYRPEFGRAARFTTPTVDGSKLDARWTGFGGFLRTRYWGFDAAHMPLQGRVWMPEGNGPFPLVLIVHGNHRMEEASDPGYAYLGELLASQGFIFVSVDENFLNSSLADFADPIHIRNGEESRARAWLLLEHLKQWRSWNGDAQHPLHGRVDMDRIALIGHSRGGEAVAVANAFNDLGQFPDDATVPFDYHFHLRAIAAIAPADGQYKPRDWPTPMSDTNYFVIHGSMDGDVTSFFGSSQYSRATFTGETDAFKANLYVKGANHGQFNTSWGRNDLEGFPFSALLDERPIMDPEAQRRILKVYLSAFLHATLKGEDAYRPLFQDARNGAGWLPDDFLINNYADSRTQWLANYEEDVDPSTGSDPELAINTDNLSVWRESYADLKFAKLGSPVALIGWDNRIHKARADYRFDFQRPRGLAPESDLVFSASQADIETVPQAFKTDERKVSDKALDFTIVLTDQSGHEAALPLSTDQLLYPQVKAETRRAGQIDFASSSELVLRRFRFPLKDFLAANPRLDLGHLKEIRFQFDRSPRGAIALDDVGIAASQ